MTSIEPSAAALKGLFLDPGAPLSQAWLQTSKIWLLADSLHLLALALQIPPAAKARNVYGHGRTARQMHKVSSKYWSPGLELADPIKQESQHLNPVTMLAPLAPRDTLCCDLQGTRCVAIPSVESFWSPSNSQKMVHSPRRTSRW
jgi:hypothetical protein